MFILILFYSVSWLWCLGWNPEICLGTEEKHDYFLTILVRGTLFVVGVLEIQPKAVGVRQVLHSTARAHLEQDLAPWESSECIGKSPDQYLTYIKGNGFRVAGRLRVRHIWGRTQELCFSLSHALLVFPSLLSSFPFWDKISDWPGTQRVYLPPSTEIRGVCYYTTRNLYSW